MAEDITTKKQLKRANTLTAVGTGFTALGAIGEGISTQRSAALRAAVLQQNAAANRVAAEDARARGATTADEIRKTTRQRIAEQRAALAANGVVVDQDTALDLVTETAGIGAVDAITALNNAEQEAAQFLRQASIQEQEAKLERRSGLFGAISSVFGAGQTILTGASTIGARNRAFKVRGKSE